MTRIHTGLILTLAAACLAGCETGHGAVRPLPGVQIVEDADPDAVELLVTEPDRAYTLLGRVRATADARIEGRIDEARRAAERALRRQGASVGADAVVIDEAVVMDLDGGAVEPLLTGPDAERDRLRPGGAAYATRPVHRVVLVGRALRWVGGPEADL